MDADHAQDMSLSARRAWIEIWWLRCWQLAARSLSARRAWIEIIAPGTSVFRGWVALRKESVDRNTQRRDFKALGLLVALRKESVDRNAGLLLGSKGRLRRSPQGERG